MQRLFLIAIASALSLFADHAPAADYPNRSVQVVLPFGPGQSDLMARATATCLSERFKQPFVVINKAGAGGLIGANAIKSSPPDGYTLGFAASTMISDYAMSVRPTFDVRRDLEPITKVLYGVQGVFVNGALPVQTMGELVAYAKANPGKINYGTTGIGSVNHLTMEALGVTAGIKLVHIPYPKGNVAFMTALMVGELQMAMTDVNAGAIAGDTGKVRLVAILARERLPSRPNVPLLQDTVPGMAKYIGNLWYGYFAPAQTPKDIIDTTYTALKACMNDDKMRAQFKNMGYESTQFVGNRPEEFKASIHEDFAKITGLVNGANIKRGE